MWRLAKRWQPARGFHVYQECFAVHLGRGTLLPWFFFFFFSAPSPSFFSLSLKLVNKADEKLEQSAFITSSSSHSLGYTSWLTAQPTVRQAFCSGGVWLLGDASELLLKGSHRRLWSCCKRFGPVP